MFGREGKDTDAITPLGSRPDIVGFRKKPAGIERRDVDRQSLRKNRMRDGLILKSKTCREHHAAGDFGADRRQALKQIERGKAFHKSAGDGCENFPILGLRSMGASIARVDDRRVISGIIYVIRNGLRWRDAPREYGPHKTIYNRFVRWSRLGVFNKIFAELARNAGKPQRLMIDATHLKAHRTAASLFKKGLFPAVSGARRAV